MEYELLKEEQRARIGFRDNLLYVTLVAMGATVAAVIPSRGHANLLLLLPPVSLILGWTYLINDEKISAIGRYVRKDLGPRLAAVVGLPAEQEHLFGWEVAHRSDSRRISRKYFQLAVDLVMFCGALTAAIIVFWANGPRSAIFMAISIVEIVAIGVLAQQIAVYADLKKGAS